MGTEIRAHPASGQSLYYTRTILAYLDICILYVALFKRQAGFDLLTAVTHSRVVKRKPKISEEHITTISRVKE
jgi:hypothetical protein